MNEFNQKLRDLVERARTLHAEEKDCKLESVFLVGKLVEMHAPAMLGIPTEKSATLIGLTISQFWKRSQAARTIRFFPETLAMVRAGDIPVGHLSLIAAKITEANAAILLAGIRGKSKREVEQLLSVLSLNGTILDREPTVEIRMTLTKSQLAVLDRARDVLAAGGHVPATAEILMKALADLLEKRDPLRKAERAAKRREQRGAPTAPAQGCHAQAAKRSRLRRCPTAASRPGHDIPAPAQRPGRPGIGAAIKHHVWLRDQGQCTWIYPNGERCEQTMMLELDHQKMWCRGGGHSVANLTLRCRYHNQMAARKTLGEGFMDRKRTGQSEGVFV